MTSEPTVDRLGLKIADPEWTVERLTAEIENRLSRRPRSLGDQPINFPSFGYQTPLPAPLEGRTEYITLHHYLRQLNELPRPESDAVLADSAALRMPFLGRLWRLIRAQAHQLVLFYVNRAQAHETVVNSHTISLFNEMTRLIQQQQQEIAQLQADVAQLQEAQAHEK